LLDSIEAGVYAVRLGARLFQDGHWLRGLPGGEYLGYLAAAAFVVIVIWLQWSRERRMANSALGAWWSVMTALLLSPLLWWFYLTWLLPALMLCLNLVLRRIGSGATGRGWRSWALRWGPLAALAVSYGLMLIPAYNTGAANYRTAAVGVLLLWLLCGALYLESAGVRLPGSVAMVWSVRRSSAAAPAAGGVDVAPR
jgi:hypothetical protein